MTDINSKLEEMSQAVTELRSTSEANLTSRDVLLEQKESALNTRIDQLNDQIAELTRNAVRPQVSTEDRSANTAAEFRNYVLAGELASRAVTTGTPSAGGYAVPEQFDANIVALAKEVSPLLGEVTVQKVGTPDVKIHVNKRGTTSSWVNETGTDGMYAETATPELDEIAVPFGTLFAKPLISHYALNDMYFDAEAFVTGEIGLEFSQKVGASILTGNGTTQPKGILTQARGTGYGQIETVKTGAAAAITSADALIKLVHSVKAQYRGNAKFVLNRSTLATIRSLKDSNGQYLWQPSLVAGNPGTVLGYSVIEAEDMESEGAAKAPVLFGDLNAYRLYDLVGMTMLRDPYSYDAYIAIKAMKRFGGIVANAEAFKLLVCSA